jgi:hypothetical protein
MTYTRNELNLEPKHVLEHKALLAKKIINLILARDMETGKMLS